jgi:hypothetical protein
MVNSCAIRQPVANDGDRGRALRAAIGLWAVIEAAESLPASTETQQRLGEARHALNVRLARLGWDEDSLRLALQRGQVVEGDPPDPTPGRGFVQ